MKSITSCGAAWPVRRRTSLSLILFVAMVVATLAACWLALWQGTLRWLGMPLALAAVVVWAGTQRPDLLIARDGGLVDVARSSGSGV